jgi:choline dehydrogenase
LIEQARAVGVEFLRDRAAHTARADREVVLSAGAFNSPQLLMLSGVGNAGALRRLGIAPVHDLPGVGTNLQDHPLVGLRYACRRPVSLYSATSAGSVLRYVMFRKGLLTSNVAEALAFVRSRPDIAAPDLELVFAPVYYDVMNPPSVHAFSIGAVALHPRSVGSVMLRSADPFEPPIIDPAYLTDPEGEDARVLAYGLRLAQTVAKARALDGYRGELLFPSGTIESDEEIYRFIAWSLETIYHPAGTCRMGQDRMAVVDPVLRVRGIDRLRVVDASVMPRLVRAHPNAAIIMIAERAADLIRKLS